MRAVRQGETSVVLEVDEATDSVLALVDRRIRRPGGVLIVWTEGEVVTGFAAFAIAAGDSAAG